jgi:hypothetical protein
MIADKIYCPRLLIVSGSGKKAGKTTLVSSIIRAIKDDSPIVAIKISPHFHPVKYEKYLCNEPGKFMIYEENSFLPENDSSKMKQSGAFRVFYIQVKDTYVGEAFLKCMDYVENDAPVICESGSLSRLIAPGLMIFISQNEMEIELPEKYLNSDMVVIKRDQEHFKSIVNRIYYHSGQWEYQKQEL